MRIIAALIVVLVSVLLPWSVRAQTTAVVSFTFDDVPKSVATVALPILDKYGFPATVYVATRNTNHNYPDYMNWDDVALVASHEWEIGAHTHTHPHLTKLSDAEILDDLLTSTQDFAKHGYAPTDFASPFGDMDDRVLAIIKRHYQSHRAAWPAGVNTTKPDPYNIASYEVGNDTTMEDIGTLLDGLQTSGGWLVLQVHYVTPKGVAVEQEYDTNLLEDIVELVHSHGFPVLTMREALALFEQKEGE